MKGFSFLSASSIILPGAYLRRIETPNLSPALEPAGLRPALSHLACYLWNEPSPGPPRGPPSMGFIFLVAPFPPVGQPLEKNLPCFSLLDTCPTCERLQFGARHLLGTPTFAPPPINLYLLAFPLFSFPFFLCISQKNIPLPQLFDSFSSFPYLSPLMTQLQWT